MSFRFPKIYPILDVSFLPAAAERAAYLERLGSALAEAGVTLLEYRNKNAADAEIAADAAVLRRVFPVGRVRLILDDRVDLVEQIGFDGVHVDSGDLAPAEARRLLGPSKIIGTFGGGEALLPNILEQPVDYFAVGPVFATVTKQVSLPLIGIDGVRELRRQAGPGPVLSAVGGLNLERAAQALEAGATMVAVAGGLFRQSDPAAEFRRWMERLEK